ncbi:MAG: hypothetical protein ABGZ35_11370 [Planctomycetaceae bacterium]
MTEKTGSMKIGCVEEIATVLETRRDTCRQLLELSFAQREHIRAQDYGGLLLLLTEKQSVLSRHDALSQQFSNSSLQQWWAESRDTLEPFWQQRCRSALQDTEQILGELLAHEQQCTDLLTHHRNATYDQLQEISQGNRVHDAYRDNLAPRTHRHLNVDQ